MRFISPYREYAIVIKPDQKIIVGNDLVLKRGITVKFKDGMTDDIKDPALIEKLIEISKRDKEFFPDLTQEEMRKMKENRGEIREVADEPEEENQEAIFRKAGRPKRK